MGRVRSYRTFSPLLKRQSRFSGISLLHLSWGHPRRALPVILALRSPDFPHLVPFGIQPRLSNLVANNIVLQSTRIVKSPCKFFSLRLYYKEMLWKWWRYMTVKKYRICAILNYISAIAFYLAATINLLNADHHSMGLVWMCLGSTFLCLGSLCLKKSKGNKDSKEEKVDSAD